MSESTSIKTVTVRNRQGLHFRPADLFIKVARQYESKIEVIKDGERVDGKSILDITMLGAEKGTLLIIEATGCDAEAAVMALVELIEIRLLEEDTEENEALEQESGENAQNA